MKIDAERAKPYFAHPSQQIAGLDPEFLPDEGFHYYAHGPVCGVFHEGPCSGVFFGHYGVLPEKWGSLTQSARAVLHEFAAAQSVKAIVGWTDSKNRAALAFNRRIGFTSRDEIAPGVIEQVWRP